MLAGKGAHHSTESWNSDTSHLAEGLFPSFDQQEKSYCSLTVLGEQKTAAMFINLQQHFCRGQHLHQSLPLPQGSGKQWERETGLLKKVVKLIRDQH